MKPVLRKKRSYLVLEDVWIQSNSNYQQWTMKYAFIPVRYSGSGTGSDSSSWHWTSVGTDATTMPSGSCCSMPRAKFFCLMWGETQHHWLETLLSCPPWGERKGEAGRRGKQRGERLMFCSIAVRILSIRSEFPYFELNVPVSLKCIWWISTRTFIRSWFPDQSKRCKILQTGAGSLENELIQVWLSVSENAMLP